MSYLVKDWPLGSAIISYIQSGASDPLLAYVRRNVPDFTWHEKGGCQQINAAIEYLIEDGRVERGTDCFGCVLRIARKADLLTRPVREDMADFKRPARMPKSVCWQGFEAYIERSSRSADHP